jgi:hypothetical protein
VIRVGKGEPPIELIRTPGPRPRRNASAVDAVLDERRSGW